MKNYEIIKESNDYVVIQKLNEDPEDKRGEIIIGPSKYKDVWIQILLCGIHAQY